MARVRVEFLAPSVVRLWVPMPDGSERILLVDSSVTLWHSMLYRLITEYGTPRDQINQMTWIYEIPDDVLETICKLAEMKTWFLEYLAYKIPLKTLKKLVNEAYNMYLAEKAVTT